ncbi:MAG: YHYH protein [Planctomycetales bacterium]|nr:YHYH protein [Planctomycetales bacterium]
MLPLGGRWYYLPQQGKSQPPAQFDHTNADRLFYLAERLETPFADNMSAWLRPGFKDLAGSLVETDHWVANNVVVRFTDEHLVVHSQGLPNHPTATFPDRTRSLDGNPNYIQQHDNTWYIPLAPKEAADRRAMQNENNNDHALPMGPIGVAVNGVVFFNPFDHLLDEDAVWRLDRCCGHPAPNWLYHYHKYPVCVKSPWCDDGAAHSPLIGFAFDGFPVYGPYEAAGELAKSSLRHPLNEFNVHHDDQRGWHYHVTPGQFPHIIGGYWGVVETKNRRRGAGPPAAGPSRRPPPSSLRRPPR